MFNKPLIIMLLLSVLLPGYVVAGEDYVPSLITDTPYEGRQLAIKLARKSIGEMQSDSAVKKRCAQSTLQMVQY